MTGKILSFGNPFFKGSRDRDPVEQILYQTERTEPSADEATENRAEQHQKSDDIKGKPIVPAGEDCLQGADRTGAEGAGAGVAVQSGDAKCLRGSGIDPSGGEAVQISVCDCQEEQLNDQPRMFDDFLKKVYFSKTACPFFFQNLLCILYIKKELSQYTVLFTIIYEKLQFSLVLLIPVFLLYVNLYPTVDFLFEFSPNIQLVYLALKTFVLLGETSPHK